MESSKNSGRDHIDGQEPAVDLAEYGITRISIDYYHYKEYRYSNLKDAIAQAVRDRKLDL